MGNSLTGRSTEGRNRVKRAKKMSEGEKKACLRFPDILFQEEHLDMSPKF